MRERRASILVIGLISTVTAGCLAARPGTHDVRSSTTRPVVLALPDDLYRVDDPTVIVSAARALMAADENMALITVDAQGQPRVRSVKAFLPDVDPVDPQKALTVWVMTRSTTRKVEQIKNHNLVTLYFNDDENMSYLSIMGMAVVHTDPHDPQLQHFLGKGYEEFFWPEFPKDFVMIEIRPRWIEFMGPGVKNHSVHWRPQAVTFPAQ